MRIKTWMLSGAHLKNNKTNIIAITLVPYFNIDGKIEKYLIILTI